MFAGEEEKRRAHEALEKQEAELARYAQQVAADQQQAAALQAKIKAMEEKVTCIHLLRTCSHLLVRHVKQFFCFCFFILYFFNNNIKKHYTLKFCMQSCSRLVSS